MKKLTENLPLILFVALAPLSYSNIPNIAQSIIIGVLGALVGYRYYLDSLTKPDYLKLFKERLDAKDIEINSVIKGLEIEIRELRAGQSKLNIVKNQEETRLKHKW